MDKPAALLRACFKGDGYASKCSGFDGLGYMRTFLGILTGIAKRNCIWLIAVTCGESICFKLKSCWMNWLIRMPATMTFQLLFDILQQPENCDSPARAGW